MNGLAEAKKQFVTAQHVFLTDKKDDKPEQDVVSIHLLSGDINLVKQSTELLH